MGPEGNILVNSPITTFQQSLTHSAIMIEYAIFNSDLGQERLSYSIAITSNNNNNDNNSL